MINKIKLFFDQHISMSDEESEQNLHLACAALFIEMMHMDDKVHAIEHEMVLDRFKAQFSLSSERANTLFSLAEQQWQQSTDYHQFTSLINKEFTQLQKVGLIKSLWQIAYAYADGELDMHEEYLVRKMADLLYVPHKDFIKTKHQASGE